MNFQAITGQYFDRLCAANGLRTTRLRTIDGQEIRPAPLLSHMGQQSTTDIGFQLEDAELLDTWEASIPKATLTACFGANWADAVAPDKLWEISDDGQDWKVYRSYGQPGFSNADAGNRVKMVLKADVNNADTLGFEAPYVP